VYLPYSNGNNYIRPAGTSNYTIFDSQAGITVGHQAQTAYRLSISGASFLQGNVRVGGGQSIYTGLPLVPMHIVGNGGSLLLEGVDHTYITFYPDGFAAGRKSYFGFADGATNTITLKNEISGGDVEISTTGGGDINLNASVWAKEVVVQLTDPWPDFVFTKTYSLYSLSDLEAYINLNKHLPNVPSAKEVSEDGVNLGEMDAILLQKIEELTLYTINQQKQIEAQAKNFNEQKELIEKQAILIEQLMKLID